MKWKHGGICSRLNSLRMKAKKLTSDFCTGLLYQLSPSQIMTVKRRAFGDERYVKQIVI